MLDGQQSIFGLGHVFCCAGTHIVFEHTSGRKILGLGNVVAQRQQLHQRRPLTAIEFPIAQGPLHAMNRVGRVGLRVDQRETFFFHFCVMPSPHEVDVGPNG